MKDFIISIKKVLIIIFWLLLWQIVAMIVNKPIILPSLTDCLNSLTVLMTNKVFYMSIFTTLYKAVLGLLLAYIFAIIISFISYKINIIYDFLDPVIQLLKSCPISSIVIFILIFTNNSYLSTIISFIVVFPIVYYNCYTGYKNCDENLLKLAKIYKLSLFNRLFYIYREQIAPYLLSINNSTVSLALKSSIACEIIGLTANSIGLQFYYCKLNLETAELFCYTFIIVILASLLEKLLAKVVSFLGGNYD